MRTMARVNIGTHASGAPVSNKEHARGVRTGTVFQIGGPGVNLFAHDSTCPVCIKDAHLQRLEKISVAKGYGSE
jgi:hypothetical protein